MHNMYDEISQYHFIDLALQCIPLCMHIYNAGSVPCVCSCYCTVRLLNQLVCTVLTTSMERTATGK